MTKIKHPTIAGIGLDVASSKIDDWLAMGWQLEASPPPIEDSPTAVAARTFPTPGDVLSHSIEISGGPNGQ